MVDAVEARGKHMMMRFSTGAALHTHMGMTGSWHLYRPGSPWRKAEGMARVVLEAGGVVAVCFVPSVAEIVATGSEESHPSLSRLGPDVLAPSRDAAPLVTGLRAAPDAEIGVALLDQAAVSGIGNIWKSEGLFLARVHPFDRVADLDDAALTRVVRAAMREMHRSVRLESAGIEGGRGGYRVYRRSGRPCPRCGTVIEMRRQGPLRRSTYWCPRCQPPVTPPRRDPGPAARAGPG